MTKTAADRIAELAQATFDRDNATSAKYRFALANGERLVASVDDIDLSPYEAFVKNNRPILAWRETSFDDRRIRITINPANVLFFEEIPE